MNSGAHAASPPVQLFGAALLAALRFSSNKIAIWAPGRRAVNSRRGVTAGGVVSSSAGCR